ncbi:MAG: TonB-dependent receptor [Bryobacteraceae bacterium]
MSSLTVRILGSLFLSSLWLLAQTTSTEVLGTVSDATGAVVPGANVTLLRTQTGERRTTVSDNNGNYSFPLIEIGDYTVTIEMQGFKSQTKTGVHVEYQQKARVNVQLEVGAATERVEVVATGVELKTDDASLGATIDHKRVVELPIVNRNFASLVVLTPGVQFGTRMGLSPHSTAGSFFPGATQVSANGQRDANQRVTLDGVIASEPLVNTVYFNPSIDAIEEVKVHTGSYSAEYGMNNGANVQVALKSGSNDFHGTFFEFLRNDAADARDYFLNFQVPAGSPRQQKNRLRRNQFGAWLAGPVLLPKIYNGKDRTFWSFNYEGTRETQESVQQAFWFPEAFRNGDFSALLTPLIRNGVPVRAPTVIYDPLTGEPFRDMQGNITNIIPPSRINRNAQNFVNTYLPLPQFTPDDVVDTNVIRSVPNVLYQNQYFARLDHQFSVKDRIFGRFATLHGDYAINNINPNFPSTQRIQNYNVAFQHLHTFSPTTLNEFRVGFNKVNNDQTNRRSNTDFDPDTLGVGQFRVAVDNNRKFRPDETGIPPTGIIGGDGGARFDLNGIYQFSDNLSFIRQSHNFKAGFELLRYGLDRAAANVPLGNLTCCPGGYNLAGWLLGYPATASSAEGLVWTAPRQNRWGAYFQDEWRATRKLTINMGLRWDFFQVPHDVNKKWRSLRLDILTQATDGRQLPTVVPEPNTDFDFYGTDNRYFMPRVGIAYRATDKWVIRAGGGWFANVQQMNNMTILDLQPPYSGTFGFNQVDQAALTIPISYGGRDSTATTRRFTQTSPILTLANPFPGQGTAAARTNVLAFTPDNKASSVVQWSLDIQRELPWSTILTAGYVGSKTSHIDNTISNFNSPATPSTDTDFNSRRPWQAYVSRGEGDQARLLGNIRYLDSFANANYHALQVQVQKRYSNGFTAGLAYTFSKALGEGYGRNDPAGGVNSTYQDPNDRRQNRGRYGFDVTHNAVLNYVWEVPLFANSRGLLYSVFGGWQSSGVITLRTGFPFSVTGGNLNTNSTTYPDRVADGRLFDDASRQLWYDPAAFRRTDCNIQNRPELCHYGNSASDALITPGLANFDLSLAKNWKFSPLGDRGRLQFRAEAFNAFNSPQFGQPTGLTYASNDSIIPDGPRVGEARSLRQPMRIFQFGLKLYF